jgi:hypothetical protein
MRFGPRPLPLPFIIAMVIFPIFSAIFPAALIPSVVLSVVISLPAKPYCPIGSDWTFENVCKVDDPVEPYCPVFLNMSISAKSFLWFSANNISISTNGTDNDVIISTDTCDAPVGM